MALTDYKPQFDNAYQEVFNKTLVSKEIMNTRFEAMLKFGASVERVAYDISNVLVRDVTRGAASTIDALTDTSELLTINLEKEAAFHISDGEATQAGPLNPGEVIGKQVGIKVATDLDGKCFAEVVNASYAFDTGDLTGASSGVPIALSSTTVPQMTTRMGAKLRNKNNQEVMTNMALVVDAYAASDVSQFIISKNIDLAGSVFKNGYAGDVSTAQMYISENLTGTATLLVEEVATADETLSINGVTFTAKAVPSAAGEIDISGSVDAQGGLFADAINNTDGNAAGEGSATTYFEVSAADRLLLAGISAVYDSATDTLTITGVGTGRITASSTFSSGITLNYINAYYGKKGAIDLVIQDLKPVDMRVTADRRGTNVFSSYLAGIKTFADGAKKFLNVKINA